MDVRHWIFVSCLETVYRAVFGFKIVAGFKVLIRFVSYLETISYLDIEGNVGN